MITIKYRLPGVLRITEPTPPEGGWPVDADVPGPKVECTGRTVVLRRLNPEAIISLMEQFPRSPARLSAELAKAALHAVDDVPVGTGADRARMWGTFDPKEQALLMEAYNVLHNPTVQEHDAFFASAEIQVTE